ncbi:MAG: Rne/Rng family ribonuclease [Candidatus Omnitrophota bacterium]
MMQDKILISSDLYERRVAFVLDNKLDKFYMERLTDKHLVGSIYKGKVSAIVAGIEAAFVDLGVGKNGFLYVSDTKSAPSEYEIVFDEETEGLPVKEVSFGPSSIGDILKKGQEILVQVTKEPFGTKGPRLTTDISLAGRYLVFMPYDKRIGISKKIESAEERKRLKEILSSLRKYNEGGYIVRTAADGCSKQELIRDFKYLRNLWQRIKKNAEKKVTPSLIHEELDLALRITRDSLNEEISQVIIDSKEEYKKIWRFLKMFEPKLCGKLVFYTEPAPLFEKYNIEKDIENIFQRKIQLRSGGYIIIEPTEALVAIDVNSGKFTKQKSLEETVFITNLEAAEEVAKQIKLRDLGGIIIIDFIDMKRESHRKKVLNKLKDSAKDDKAKINIYGFAELGLVKLSRQRMRRSFESVSYGTCPYCMGRGLVKSEKTMAILALRKAQNYLRNFRRGRMKIDLFVHPFVAERLKGEDSFLVSSLEKKTRTKIDIVGRENFHIEDFEIEG